MKNTMTKVTRNEAAIGIRNGYALLELASGWLKQGNPVVAIELLRPALESVEAGSDQELRANIMKEIGRVKMMQSDWQESDMLYLEAQRLFLDIENFKGAAECARNRANMMFQKGDYKLSEELCEQALEWASMIQDYELRASIFNTSGAIKSTMGDMKEAIKTFKLCLSDFESAGNQIRQGYVLLNIGLAHTELEEYAQALDSLNKALAISLREKDLNLVEICYINIAKCYLGQNETTLTLAVMDTAQKILPGLNSRSLECELNLLQGRVARMMGDLDRAESILQSVHTKTIQHQLTALTPEIMFELGLAAMARGQYELARTRVDSAANQFKSLGIDKLFRKSVDLLSKLREKG